MTKNKFKFASPVLSAHLTQVMLSDIQQLIAEVQKHKPSQVALQWPNGYQPDFLLLQALEMMALKGIQVKLPEVYSPSELIGTCFSHTFSRN
ncbi:hypothetical protein QWY31_11460 [Cytophagales bacterium LB-30]|uniref:Uncharacterized protein n=1 Tax=Shiella aurantiaca TaxID=3058365 RepID=A0ABT8F6L3_9BACT|nr:hypothetical protein [Shiella aurantiaca]MDN4166123.1 hypothetical protein [Shiella aurantiaca]